MLKKISFILIVLFFTVVNPAVALEMPSSAINPEISGLTAKSYVVVEEANGNIILAKDENMQWTPASLTKLVTAMVVLDYSPKLSKTIAMSKIDEVGGGRLAVVAGEKYKQKDLFYASLVASANNATVALARSTGLTLEQFVEKMNQKALSLGAENTYFLEPAGMSEKNTSTALDYVKIAKKAFSIPAISEAVAKKTYSFRSLSGKKLLHNIKTTNKLLGDTQLKVLAGKTGYLEESMRNFVARVETSEGKKFLVVVFGSKNSSTQFAETKELALYAFAQLKDLQKNVLGVITNN
jgi:serine-type D-Ala-D-Ala carboxypeptidase (penicillin-binding protein 5/6)